MRDKIVKLLKHGVSYSRISKKIGCSKSTVAYHAKRIGISEFKPKSYDWEKIQKYYDKGYSIRECSKRFGFSPCTWRNARKKGLVKSRPQCPSIETYLKENAKCGRTHVKKRLLRKGLLKNKCKICGMLPEWNGKPLVFVLDHKNGVSNDYRLKNLRLLCPNCNSQTPTFSGRNKRKKFGVVQRQDSAL